MTPRKLSRTAKIAVTMILASIAAFAPAGNAGAATTVPADRSAWFWSSNQKVTTCTLNTACPGASVGSGAYGNAGANPISPGHLGVAMRNNQSDMRAYLHFDTGTIPQGAQITSFVVSLTVAKRSDAAHSAQHSESRLRPPATLNDEDAAMQACLMREPWGDNVQTGGGGDPPASTEVESPADSKDNRLHSRTEQNEPPADCSTRAQGKRSKDGKRWTFDITEIAQKWASGQIFNEGIALVPVSSTVAPTWVVEFHGPPLTLNSNGDDVVAVSSKDAARAVVQFTGGTSAGTGGTIGPLPPAPPPISGPTFGAPPPSTPEMPPAGGPPVEVAPTAPSGGAGTGGPGVTPVGAQASTPPWLAGVFALVLLGLGMIWTTVGTDSLGLELPAGSNRVAGVLQGRRLAGAARPQAVEAIKQQEMSELEQN